MEDQTPPTPPPSPEHLGHQPSRTASELAAADLLEQTALLPEPVIATAPPPPPGQSVRSKIWSKARSNARSRLRYLVVYPLITVILGVITGIVVAASIRKPEVEELDFSPRLITRLFDHQGEVVQSYSREKRVLLAAGDVPQVLENAILAVEDANFHEHGGIDLKGILRAMVTNIRERRLVEGASTITMQLARDLFDLTRQQDIRRKIEEAFLAVELEKKFSKQQILTMYCNQVNLSQGNYGMEAASRNYFGKSVGALTLAEAATLAGIPQRPTYHNPYDRPEAVSLRRNVVLARMLDEKMITREEYRAAADEPLLVVPRRRKAQLGPYFTEEVRRDLISTYGEAELYDRGLGVQTTLHREIQQATEESLREELLRLDKTRGWRALGEPLEDPNLEQLNLPSWRNREFKPGGEWAEGVVLESGRKTAKVKVADRVFELDRRGIKWTRKSRPEQLLERGDVTWFRLEEGKDGADPVLMLEQEPQVEAAAVVIESETGAIRALVGGWNYQRNEFNRITQARRQVGSAMKPFVYGAALEIGFTAADTLFDGPVVFRGADNKESYSPRNYYRKYEGIMTLRTALERSLNVPAVKLLDMVGIDQVIDFSRRCGLTSELPPYPSLALGAADLTPLELAAAYATIVNQGVYVEPYLIESVSSRSGRRIYEHQPKALKAMEPQVAYILTSILRGVATRGTGAGRLARIEIPTAGKTGTTNSFTDAWFVGFTPRYTLLTWVGFDQKRFLGRGWTGAHAALPIWSGIIERGLEAGWLSKDEEFPVPPGIVEREIEASTGWLASPSAHNVITEVFIEGTEPERRFTPEWERIVQMPWYLQETFYIPKEGERMPAQVHDWGPILEAWKGKEKGKS
jgi:penicillin-binding protein 1A